MYPFQSDSDSPLSSLSDVLFFFSLQTPAVSCQFEIFWTKYLLTLLFRSTSINSLCHLFTPCPSQICGTFAFWCPVTLLVIYLTLSPLSLFSFYYSSSFLLLSCLLLSHHYILPHSLPTFICSGPAGPQRCPEHVRAAQTHQQQSAAVCL